MKTRTKRYLNLTIVIAVTIGVFVYVSVVLADDESAKVSGAEPVFAKQIYGVQCRLLPDREVWQTSEIPTLKAYVLRPGSSDLRLATIAQQGCQLKVDEHWYRYVNPEWTGGIGVLAQTDWLVRVGGFLPVSLNKEHWVRLGDSTPLVLISGEHTISLGWAGYKEDPTSNSSHEDNPILLLSDPVQIKILEPKVPAREIIPADENLRRITELFDSYVYRTPLTQMEQKLGIKTDLRSFHNWRPKFMWEDITVLLELAQDEELLDGMPSLMISSYIGQSCRKGMIALWLIEGLRREKLSLIREKQLGEKLHPASFRLPLNPICVKEGMGMSECEKSLEIHRAVLEAYRQWWRMVESLPAGQAAVFYPLDMTDVRWFGAGDLWPEEPLEIYEEISSDGMAATRTIKHLQKTEGTSDYEPGKILQEVYYTLKNPGEKPPFTSDMLKIQKITLHYYDGRGDETRTVDIVPGSVRSAMKKG